MAEERTLDDLELYLLEVMEERRKGLTPDLLRLAAGGASYLYAGGVALRGWLYARGVLKRRRAPLPVISVGNLTAGGTGKTPFVSYLAQGLSRQGHKPAILARGYRARSAGGTNDELDMLARQCPQVLTLASANRLTGCLRAADQGANAVLLDDGFGHLALQRDLDILLIDGTRPFGNGHLLPRGTLREPVEAAARADLAVITRADLAGLAQVGELRTWLSRLKPGLPVIECCFRPKALRPLTDSEAEPAAPEELSGRKVAAFAALADPRSFGRTLRGLGAELVFSRRFPDHHHYRGADLVAVARGAAEAGAQMLVTTEKDAVKLEDLPAPEIPLHCLTVETEVDSGEDLLWAEVGRAISGFSKE